MFSDSCGFPRASCGLGGSATVSEKLEEKVKIKGYLTVFLTIFHYSSLQSGQQKKSVRVSELLRLSYLKKCNSVIKWWLSRIIRNVPSFYSNVIINYYQKNAVCTTDVYPLEPQLSNSEGGLRCLLLYSKNSMW